MCCTVGNYRTELLAHICNISNNGFSSALVENTVQELKGNYYLHCLQTSRYTVNLFGGRFDCHFDSRALSLDKPV